MEIVRGNHEELFLSFLEEPEYEGEFYLDMGGAATVDSFLSTGTSYRKNNTYITEKIKENFEEEIAFIQHLPYYAIWKNWVFVHAGVDFMKSDWRNSSENDFTNMHYKRFAYMENEYPNRFVAGHTHTWQNESG